MFLTSGVKACTTPVLAWTSPRSRSQPSQSRLDQLRCSTPWLQLTVGAMAHCRTYKTQLTEWSGTLKTKCCEATAWCKDFKDQPSIRHSHTAGTYAKNHLHASETHEKQHLPTHEYLACASERFHRAWASNFGEIRNPHMRYQALPQETMSPKRPNQRDSRPHGLNPRLLSVKTDGGQCRYSDILGPLVPTKWYVDLLTKKQSFQIT